MRRGTPLNFSQNNNGEVVIMLPQTQNPETPLIQFWFFLSGHTRQTVFRVKNKYVRNKREQTCLFFLQALKDYFCAIFTESATMANDFILVSILETKGI